MTIDINGHKAHELGVANVNGTVLAIATRLGFSTNVDPDDEEPGGGYRGHLQVFWPGKQMRLVYPEDPETGAPERHCDHTVPDGPLVTVRGWLGGAEVRDAWAQRITEALLADRA